MLNICCKHFFLQREGEDVFSSNSNQKNSPLKFKDT